MSKLTINTRQRRFPVAPNLYGLFYEDINRGGDNGMYPELLRNRAFEDSLPPEGCTVYDEGRSIVTRFGWKDRFNNGEGLDRWKTMEDDVQALLARIRSAKQAR